jgi:hypothetical protein
MQIKFYETLEDFIVFTVFQSDELCKNVYMNNQIKIT